jgi:hypothetical protein
VDEVSRVKQKIAEQERAYQEAMSSAQEGFSAELQQLGFFTQEIIPLI